MSHQVSIFGTFFDDRTTGNSWPYFTAGLRLALDKGNLRCSLLPWAKTHDASMGRTVYLPTFTIEIFKIQPNVGKYTSPMDGMGKAKKEKCHGQSVEGGIPEQKKNKWTEGSLYQHWRVFGWATNNRLIGLQHIEISAPDINLSFSGQLAHSTVFYSGCGQLNISQICRRCWVSDDDDDDDHDDVFLWCNSCYTKPASNAKTPNKTSNVSICFIENNLGQTTIMSWEMMPIHLVFLQCHFTCFLDEVINVINIPM